MWQRLKGLRVLVVEDSWIVASSLESLLEPIGVKIVATVATLETATQVAATVPFDVAVMDLDLHGERTDPLIASLHAKRIPVIVVSGNSLASATAAKVAAMLPKPYRSGHLLEALRDLRSASAAAA